MSLPILASLGVLAALLASTIAYAGDIPTLQEITVGTTGQDLTGIADTASEGAVTAKQLATRPLLRPAEVMETVPGMIVTQHSGDGKANQYFLRGFNLDHGSDFATFVGGIPVNTASHAHGQGYMDLNFLIPELVDSLRYRKGVYAAEDGDFGVTGTARIDYRRSLNVPFMDLSLGQHNYRRALAAGSRTLDNGITVLGAAEATGYNGPWVQPEHLGRQNALLRASSGTAQNGYALTAMGYETHWIATEHVPERAILNGEIDRYGTLAPTDGGRTHRYSLSGEWVATDAGSSQKASAYVVDYGLNLFSTPSGLLDGQHEQADRRIVWGGQRAQSWFLGPDWKETEASLGVQFRQDRVDRLGLYQTVDRQRTGTVSEDRVTQSALGLYAEARSQWSPRLRSTLGLRWDGVWAQVTPSDGVFNGANGGNANASQVSPKLGLAIGPFGASSELYANWGRGFHSNDARGTTSRVNLNDGTAVAPTPLLVKATGSEIGLRVSPLPGWYSSLSLWRVELASELVFIGADGVTEPKSGSRRHGLEWANFYADGKGLIMDANLALSQARFVEASNGGTHVPNAIPVTASVGVALDRGDAWFSGLRVRYLGAYSLEETGAEKSTPFWTANLKLGYRVDKNLQFTLDVLNLFNRKANDIEFWGATCTRAEGTGCNSGNGIDGRMLHPLEPRTLRLSMRVSL